MGAHPGWRSLEVRTSTTSGNDGPKGDGDDIGDGRVRYLKIQGIRDTQYLIGKEEGADKGISKHRIDKYRTREGRAQ